MCRVVRKYFIRPNPTYLRMRGAVVNIFIGQKTNVNEEWKNRRNCVRNKYFYSRFYITYIYRVTYTIHTYVMKYRNWNFKTSSWSTTQYSPINWHRRKCRFGLIWPFEIVLYIFKWIYVDLSMRLKPNGFKLNL